MSATVEYKGRVLPKGWPKEVAKMVREILEDYDNPETEVTLEVQTGNSLDGGHTEKITVTRRRKSIWSHVIDGEVTR